jgi:hypothetical protein
MPIVYRVDHESRVVVAAGKGTLTDADVFSYQREVWSRADVAGYNELIDMTGVKQISLPSAERVRDLAELAAGMDNNASKSRLAIVASGDGAFGLGRMFQSYRELNPQSTKEVGVFRTMPGALAWLRIDHSLAMPEST